MLSVCSVNVNGIRAAQRRGGVDWLAEQSHDLVLLQEVRASTEQLRACVTTLGDQHIAHAESDQPGRAGVAIVSSLPLTDVREGLDGFERAGRWVEGTAETTIGPVRFASVYVHTGQADTPKQDEKYHFLRAMTLRLEALAAKHERVLVCGDLNIAHTPLDIRNAKGNVGKAGFLPAEQAYLSSWLEAGWVDLGRHHAGDVDGPYTWWTWRGQAFDRDVGWRIDYAHATPTLAAELRTVNVGRAASRPAVERSCAGGGPVFGATGR